MEKSFMQGEADPLRQYCTYYCLLKENLQVHSLYWYDWTKFPYFCQQQPKEPLCWFSHILNRQQLRGRVYLLLILLSQNWCV